jgi:hypothetical protein
LLKQQLNYSSENQTATARTPENQTATARTPENNFISGKSVEQQQLQLIQRLRELAIK